VGREVAVRRACFACHTIDGQRHVGPTWRGLYDSKVELTDGRTVTADESYLTKSMMEPRADVVVGYNPVMPSYHALLTEPETAALVEYIKSLRDVPNEPGVVLPKVETKAVP
jgi:cytochrome c oxidase subunit 2